MNSTKKVERILLDELIARGHPNILGTHRTTIEITTEDFLTTNGNCIIGIMSSKSVKDYNPKLKEAIQNGKKIEIEMVAGPFKEIIVGVGHNELPLSNEISMVFRLSEFISDRTALINCSKSSIELDRNFINYLKNPSNKIIVQFFLLDENK
ncbi:DUF371 domain-containing protein [Promethearchaeum syntrophicum]|uniref:DUF371 domain-containing protein n=1 Tax=Promethearchaeum syntrophicum TaxID=2594042 RepID=A0A5B9D724_9ARCH|nr:DUF371 domain-containing protein [Candidatus Prometheoarchaeum syntrophicum]QEE14939.1 hypothetical protein DSAG12_00761 [Candidatus Prometheoarchaeum syntrophicum]